MAKVSIKNILNGESSLNHRFIKNYEELKKAVQTFRDMDHKIVLTQGVYDLIHGGHAAYLEKAKSLGDILIVGVDSDALTRKRKGPGRPVVPEMERLNMLAHLRCVDIVTLRGEKDDIGLLIRTVRPDVLVVSRSTTDFSISEAMKYKPYCGKVVALPPQSVTSTSARIRQVTIEGAEKLAKEIFTLTENFLNRIRDGK